MKRISIFVSGAGSNAENIVRYFQTNPCGIEVASVMTNNPNAAAIARLRPFGIETEVFPRKQWKKPVEVAQRLKEEHVDFIVLAGFLSFINEPLLSDFAGRIVNIHPSLLPKHGGKGMWGLNVHRAVLEAGDKETGITIHMVDKSIDGGAIVEQRRCPVRPGDTPESLASRVHELEYLYYPQAIARLVNETVAGK